MKMWTLLILLCAWLHPGCFAFVGTPCRRRERGDTFDCVCTADYCDSLQLPQELESGVFYVYTSSASGWRFHFSFSGLEDEENGGADTVITISSDKVRQEVFGFGGALTDSAGCNIASLSPEAQAKLLDSYFSKNGIDYTFVRVPIGGTDFSTRFYDNIEVVDGKFGFKLQPEDYHFKIAYLDEIIQRNPNVKLLAASWRAPEWMLKRHPIEYRKMINPLYYREWAEYHKMFFDKYKEYGINFWGTSTGNEIVTGAFSIPWSLPEHKIWIDNHLGPLLKDNDYKDLKILFLDDQTTYIIPWINLLHNDTTKKYADGIATHWYVDEKIYLHHEYYHQQFPDKILLSTEASICKYEKDFQDKRQWYGAELYADNIIQKMNFYCNGWIDWNLALDPDGGPNNTNNTCLAPITVNATADEFYKGPIFYAMGHFSKFILPGSKNVQISVQPKVKNLSAAAFAVDNAPWNIAIVILNKNPQQVTVRVCVSEDICAVIVATPRSIISAIADVPTL